MNQEKEGVVSVWVGEFSDEADYERYIAENYGQINNSPLSEFANDAGLGWYDYDLREADFNPGGPLPIRTLLLGTSYSNSFIDEVIEKAEKKGIEKGNAIFLLYDYDYAASDTGKSRLQFAASVPYDKSAPASTE